MIVSLVLFTSVYCALGISETPSVYSNPFPYAPYEDGAECASADCVCFIYEDDSVMGAVTMPSRGNTPSRNSSNDAMSDTNGTDNSAGPGTALTGDACPGNQRRVGNTCVMPDDK